MKKLILSALLILSASLQANASENALNKVRHIVHARFRSDLKTVIKFEKNTNLCGATGDAYVVEVQVKHWHRHLDDNSQNLTMVPSWETVKTYAILASDLNQGKPELMDFEACLE